MTPFDATLIAIGVLLLWTARKRWLRKMPRAPVQFAGRGWTWDQLCQGVIVFGCIGSGKSYSTDPLLEQLIAAGTPMLVTSVKPDEFRRYERICTKLGCMDRLVLVNDKNRNADGKLYSLGFLAEILKTSTAADAASFIMDMQAAGGGGHGDQDPFWRNMTHSALRYAIRLVQLAYGQATIMNVYDIIRHSPINTSYGHEEGLDKLGYACMKDDFAKAMVAVERKNNPAYNADYNRIQSFFRTEMCSTEKIRGSVLSSVMGTLGRLVDQPWRDLLSETVISPEIIQRDRLIVVVAMAVMQMHEPARLFNSLQVMMAQRYLMQRDARQFVEPFVIVRDEAGWVLSAEWDAKAHAVLRSQKCCSVAIVQDHDVLKAALGGSNKSDMEAMAFASQHMHKLAFHNYSQSTNSWFSELSGKFQQVMVSAGHHEVKNDLCAEALGCQQMGWSTHFEPVVRPEAFTQLRVGCAYLFSGGRVDYVDLRRKQ